MRQHRKFGLIPILLVGLVGCGNDNETANEGGRTDATPIGYYSNEKHGNNGGNAILLDGADNDGPVTEIMDHTYGAEQNTNQKYVRVKNENNNNNQVNHVNPIVYPNSNFSGYEGNLYTREPLIGGSDQNYHGHLNSSNPATRQSYDNRNNGNTNEKVTQLVENVENVREAKTVIYGDKVLVGVLLNNNDREKDTRKDIRQAIQPYLNGKELHLLTSDHQFSVLTTIDNDLRNGGPKDQLNMDLNNLIHMNNNNR